MEKIGCSNISIALTLVGVLPLIGGLIGMYQVFSHLDFGIKYSWLFQSIFLLGFGLVTCGYRNCLYINNEHLQIVRSIFFYKFKKKTYLFSQFNNIHIEIRHPVVTANDRVETPFYAILFRGDADTVDITDHMRFKKNVVNKKSWNLVKELLNKLSSISDLKISYSDKVKSYNSL